MSTVSKEQIIHLVGLCRENSRWHRRRAREVAVRAEAAYHLGQAKVYWRVALRLSRLEMDGIDWTRFPRAAVWDRLLRSDAAQRMYQTSPLFHMIAERVRAAEQGREDPIVFLGAVLAAVCEAREDWMQGAIRRLALMEGPPLVR